MNSILSQEEQKRLLELDYVKYLLKGDYKMKIHSFGETNPNHKCYGKQTRRTPLCGKTVEKEFVTNKDKEVTCGLCLNLMNKR